MLKVQRASAGMSHWIIKAWAWQPTDQGAPTYDVAMKVAAMTAPFPNEA